MKKIDQIKNTIIMRLSGEQYLYPAVNARKAYQDADISAALVCASDVIEPKLGGFKNAE